MAQTTLLGLCHTNKHTSREKDIASGLLDAFETSSLPLPLRLQAFPRHVRRQDIARFLVKYELFKLALPIHGSVIECGVFTGGGWHPGYTSRLSWNPTIIPGASSASIRSRAFRRSTKRIAGADNPSIFMPAPLVSTAISWRRSPG